MIIPIFIRETSGIERAREPVAVGVPFSRGQVLDVNLLRIRNGEGEIIPLQVKILGRWPDLSVKWALLEFIASMKANATVKCEVTSGNPIQNGDVEGIKLLQNSDNIQIDTGVALFILDTKRFSPFYEVHFGGSKIHRSSDCRVRLLDTKGLEYEPQIESIVVETPGPLAATVAVHGCITSASGGIFCNFMSRLTFFFGRFLAKIDFTVLNPNPARHRGGLWDLGDEGSVYFKDLAMSFRLGESSNIQVKWTSTPDSPVQNTRLDSFCFYQDSSGGENWYSPNHVDRFGNVTNAFCGYRVYLNDEIAYEGKRASPVLSVDDGEICITAAVPYFWQNFPKSLEVRSGELFVHLFPARHAGEYELQGGEQKTHTIYLDFGMGDKMNSPQLNWVHDPLLPVVSPEWMAESGVFPYLLPRSKNTNQIYNILVDEAIEGDGSFFARREIIDEYGWRNFGDLYADHETLYYKGDQPLISHYNNQYDGIFGAILQYARSGNEKWFRLAAEMARHVIDIDVYHTTRDKAAYNGGLFWHTDHYVTAATATHRTYSIKNKEEYRLKDYGGGPSNEHLYTSGLLYYHLLTGDVQARETVIALAEWVLAMEDGWRTPFRFLSSKPTGLASKTASSRYHGPGRGAGNAINALIDAFVLTRDRKYLEMAENLIRRCIHPKDDIAARHLMDHEARWSYTAFLQVIGKYLDLKVEVGETDYAYHYARESLLQYAAWMVDNEVPFSECLDRLEYPTETWIVHDLRKSNVLEFAAKYAAEGSRELFQKRAEFFFENCFRDLQAFETKALTRPLVMLMSYGIMHSFLQNHPETHVPFLSQNEEFGQPKIFLPQRVTAVARGKAIFAVGLLLFGACVFMLIAFR